MKLIEVPLPEVKLIEPSVFGDNRGFFYEAHNVAKYRELGLDLSFVQDNVSRSAAGVLRGVHYQWPKPQGKLVHVLQGAIWDVAVDLRPDSPTFKKWHAEILSGENHRSFWIPPGFGHGFAVLDGPALVTYKVTEFFHLEFDAGIKFDDPELNIDWPIENPTLSAKDENLPSLREALASLPKTGDL